MQGPTDVANRLPVCTLLWFVPWIPTAPDWHESPMRSASRLRDHHFGTSVDPLRHRLRKLQSTTIIAVQLHHESTAIWENIGEKDEEKQPTPRSSKNRVKTTHYEHWDKVCIKVWTKNEKNLCLIMQTKTSDAVCWKNTGEIEAEKQPTSRSPNNVYIWGLTLTVAL